MHKLINHSSGESEPVLGVIVPDKDGSHPQGALSHNGGSLEADYIQLEDGPSTEDIFAILPCVSTEVKISAKPYTIQAITPLSWSGTSIKEVKYNKLISQLMSEDTAFSNWIKTVIMVHSESGQFETVCRVPDLWKDSIDQICIVTAGKSLDKKWLPSGYYHCMIGAGKNLND